MAELLYEDNELQALWRQGSTSYVLVTFGDMLEMAGGVTFSAEVPASKNNITCLGIMAKRPNWYPRQNLSNLRAAVEERIGSYDERILYGSSMGGHGAIKSSKLMGATTIIALCPQWSINPADREATRLGWGGEFDPLVMADMKINQSDISGTLFILSDPDNDIDENHRNKIAAVAGSCVSIPVYACDHNIAPVLAGSKNLKSIIDFCRSHNSRELLRLVNMSRRPHFARLRCVTERGLRRKPSLTLRAIFSALPRNEAISAVFKDVDGSPYEAAANHADSDTWTTYAKWLIEQTQDPIEKVRLLSLVSNVNARQPYLGVFTSFGSQIYFDVLKNELRHGDAGRRGRVPVALRRHGQRIRLDAGDHLHVKTPSDDGFDRAIFDPAVVPGGAFTLSTSNNKFLSADPSGSLACDRDEAKTWETFTSRLILPGVPSA